jgi:hypothetical protein
MKVIPGTCEVTLKIPINLQVEEVNVTWASNLRIGLRIVFLLFFCFYSFYGALKVFEVPGKAGIGTMVTGVAWRGVWCLGWARAAGLETEHPRRGRGCLTLGFCSRLFSDPLPFF